VAALPHHPAPLAALLAAPVVLLGIRHRHLAYNVTLIMERPGRSAVNRDLTRATAYLAHDVRHDRKVALMLRPELSAILGANRFLHDKTTATSSPTGAAS
jgi:hypothetical protein